MDRKIWEEIIGHKYFILSRISKIDSLLDLFTLHIF